MLMDERKCSRPCIDIFAAAPVLGDCDHRFVFGQHAKPRLLAVGFQRDKAQ
jgi:hypothetical protein